MLDLSILSREWSAPALPNEIPHGDMPGDKVSINEGHIAKANLIFPRLCALLSAALVQNPAGKAVVSVCGGSGVGKSETASLLSFYLNQLGVGAYTLSGDNYPHRIPFYNDAERLRVFRVAALRGLLASGEYSAARAEILTKLMQEGREADPNAQSEHPWMAVYQQAGREGLSGYLGTQNEIDFAELSGILAQFKSGKEEIFLKRMGREETALWYDAVDLSGISVLVVEWTHGNNDLLTGVDIPVLLNSTPEETLAHRKLRARDGAPDSPFTTMVLEIEQNLLRSQAHKAKIVVSKSCELLTPEQVQAL
jgi:alpha-galactosidase